MPTPQSSIRDGFAGLIARVARQWRRAVDRHLQPFGLTEATWLPLIHIARAAAPMRQKDLSASLVLDGSSVVRLLDALESAGLIERRGENADRRAKIIGLTEPGMAIIDRVEATSREIRAAVLTGLSDQEIGVATDVLQRVERNLAAMQA